MAPSEKPTAAPSDKQAVTPSDKKAVTPSNEKTTVTMFYPPNADGPQAMILHGAGYFEKGQLTEVADKETADGIVERKKGPRIATPEDLAAGKKKQLTGDGRAAKDGEQQTTG